MSTTLNVLIVSQPVDYGVAVYVRQLTESAVAAGHDVTVACPAADEGLPRWIQDAGARHEPLQMVRLPSVRDAFDVWTLRRLARGRDVVHLHSSKAGALGRVAAMSLGRRRPAIVFTPHFWSWLVGGRLAGLYCWIEGVLARCCDVIVAVSEREAAEGRVVLGAGGNRVMVIHNGVDRAHFCPQGQQADRAPGSPLVTCVGRFSEQKGQDVAIRAISLLRHRTARLRLVGVESQRGLTEHLRALAASLGVADRIEWRGHVADSAPELRAADMVIAPSRWEGMSLAILEAMACGAPLVVTDVQGSEVVQGAGLIVPPDDPGALAEAIDALISNKDRRLRLGAAARARSASYDLASSMRGNLELWSRLARDRSERIGSRAGPTDLTAARAPRRAEGTVRGPAHADVRRLMQRDEDSRSAPPRESPGYPTAGPHASVE